LVHHGTSTTRGDALLPERPEKVDDGIIAFPQPRLPDD
jgi:hypothetical protein